MESKEKGGIVIIRMFPGENFFDSLKSSCEKHEIKTAVVLSGLGQLKDFKLGYFKEKGNYLPESFGEIYELLALSGVVSLYDGEYEWHVHASLGDATKRVVGGHLIEGNVGVTCEVVLMKSDLSIFRRTEDESGLRGLFLEGENGN